SRRRHLAPPDEPEAHMLRKRPRCVCFVAVLGAALAAGFAPVPKPKPVSPKEELKRLQGAWEGVRLSADGGRGARGSGADTYEGDRLTCVRKGQVISRWTVALDPSRRPKAMDLKADSGELLPYTYKLEGDELTLAYRRGGDRRGRPGDVTPRDG